MFCDNPHQCWRCRLDGKIWDSGLQPHIAKRITGEATANKAFLAGIVQLDKLTDQLADEREENRRLRENLRRSQSLLQQLAPLCIQVAEVAGQKDLFE